MTIRDDRFDYGESRFVTLGLLEVRVVSILHAETDEIIRIISVTEATRHEQRLYFEGLPG